MCVKRHGSERDELVERCQGKKVMRWREKPTKRKKGKMKIFGKFVLTSCETGHIWIHERQRWHKHTQNIGPLLLLINTRHQPIHTMNGSVETKRATSKEKLCKYPRWNDMAKRDSKKRRSLLLCCDDVRCWNLINIPRASFASLFLSYSFIRAPKTFSRRVSSSYNIVLRGYMATSSLIKL